MPPIPIGIEDYREIIEKKCLYIDKTLLIKEFWDSAAKVILVTRPRRFGKTITLSMLHYFFEKKEESAACLFANTAIWKEEGFANLQGTFPMIFLSFKDVKCDSWEEAYENLQALIQEELDRTLTPLFSLLTPVERKQYDVLLHGMLAGPKLLVALTGSLKFIMKVFQRIHKKKTIILIDEYDSPITYAYEHKYYKKMVGFMRSLLSKTLKGNAYLERGFMTGVVRTAKDGIVSGLNNPHICTLLDSNFADKFGFTEKEVDQLLCAAGYPDRKEEVKSWYNGYLCGSSHLSGSVPSDKIRFIYNPWSILSYLESGAILDTYWANTGSTDLLIRLIAESSQKTQEEFALLMEGKCLEGKVINQDVTLLELDAKQIEPWSFLFFAGYVTAVGHEFKNNEHYYTLATPNLEIAKLYKKLVVSAIEKTFSSAELKDLLQALILGEEAVVNMLLGRFVKGFCSSHDLHEKDLERSLHLFVLGLLVSLSDQYIVSSNLESGTGRYDIMLCPRMPNPSQNAGVILEFKKGSKKALPALCKEALVQIQEKDYPLQLRTLGYTTGPIFCYGVASYKKELLVAMETVKDS